MFFMSPASFCSCAATASAPNGAAGRQAAEGSTPSEEAESGRTMRGPP